jgi:hypothetical protein
MSLFSWFSNGNSFALGSPLIFRVPKFLVVVVYFFPIFVVVVGFLVVVFLLTTGFRVVRRFFGQTQSFRFAGMFFSFSIFFDINQSVISENYQKKSFE